MIHIAFIENMISIMTSFFSGKPNEIMIFSVKTRLKLVNKKRWSFIYVSKIEIFTKNCIKNKISLSLISCTLFLDFSTLWAKNQEIFGMHQFIDLLICWLIFDQNWSWNNIIIFLGKKYQDKNVVWMRQLNFVVAHVHHRYSIRSKMCFGFSWTIKNGFFI